VADLEQPQRDRAPHFADAGNANPHRICPSRFI
jgi:hypothetical protein